MVRVRDDYSAIDLRRMAKTARTAAAEKAAREDKIEVPAVELPWWNTVEDQLEVARLPAPTPTMSSLRRWRTT